MYVVYTLYTYMYCTCVLFLCNIFKCILFASFMVAMESKYSPRQVQKNTLMVHTFTQISNAMILRSRGELWNNTKKTTLTLFTFLCLLFQHHFVNFLLIHKKFTRKTKHFKVQHKIPKNCRTFMTKMLRTHTLMLLSTATTTITTTSSSTAPRSRLHEHRQHFLLQHPG